MAKFFTSPKDLAAWVTNIGSEKAASVLVNLPKVGKEHLADVVETTKRIVEASDSNAAGVLYDILKVAGIAEGEIDKVEEGLEQVRAANEMLSMKVITSDEHQQMVKQAQIMRQPGQYDMPLRLCPKLPWSVGKKLISTYNCRHYCLDGIVLDDDPMRVYCGELLWRRHVADKFSSDQQDRKTGELYGGYINERFYKFEDAGTPANPDVARDGGNSLRLKPGERTRAPRPHQWSTERRMQEAREKGSTSNIMLNKNASVEGWVEKMAQDTSTEANCIVCAQPITRTFDGMHWKHVASNPGHIAVPQEKANPVTASSGCRLCVQEEPVKENEEDTAKQVILAGGRENFIKLASSQVREATSGDEGIIKAFSMAIDLKNEGLTEEDAAVKIADATGLPISMAVSIQSTALQKLASHASDAYVVNPKAKKPGPIARTDEEVQSDAQDLGLTEEV